MNKQTLRRIIANMGKPVLINDLTKSLNVVSRTFYNYWKEISEFLCSVNSENAITFDGHEFVFVGDSKEQNYLYAVMNALTFYEYRLSSVERQTVIKVLLLESDAPIINKYFEEIMCVSRNTIIEDLKQIKIEFRKYGVKINENTHYGNKIECDEAKRRRMIFLSLDRVDLIDELYFNAPCKPCITYIMNYLKILKYQNVVQKIVLEAENKFLMSVSDKDFYRMVLIICICIRRIQSNHLIIKSEIKQKSKINENLELFSQYVYNRLPIDAEFNDEESGFFLESIGLYKIVSHITDNYDNPEYISILVNEFLSKVQSEYHADLLSDQVLEEYLTAHITACFHRIKNEEILNNPYLTKIQAQYQDDFKLIKKNIYILENGLNISMNDAEIAYILMHVLASVERTKVNNRLANVLVACSTGLATGTLLSALISKYYKVNIVATVPVHNVITEVEKNHIDLIISTVPIELKTVPVVVVNALLTESDLILIRNALLKTEVINENCTIQNTSIDSEKICTNNNKVFPLICEKLIKLDKEADNWQESIIAAGEILLFHKCITPNYLHQMIDLVVKYGPYIVVAPGVALAHASPESGVIRPAVSLIRLKKGVKFGKNEFDPVNIVLACAIRDSLEDSNYLLQIMTLVRRPQFVASINKAKNSKEVMKVFNQ